MIRETRTENGAVRGLPCGNNRVTTFKGIPYAAPPVGENRWRAPKPAANWDGVKDCFDFAPISVQDTPGIGDDIYCREWHVDPEIPMSEDCLYLNIWTPAKSVDEKLPVLVWYFGGGYQWGYPNEMEFNGEHLAKEGIIVVSVNYRLGAIGFLSHPELTKNQPEGYANFGSFDQQAGLKWVRRNIANFGGDPDKITISGQSAGGASTLTQLTCPDNYNDIAGACIFSGLIRDPFVKDPIIRPITLAEAEQIGVEFLKYCGVETIEEARKLDALFIRQKYAEFRNTGKMMSNIIDGIIVREDPYEALLAGHKADVPVISGNTGDEFPGGIPAEDDAMREAVAKEAFGDKAEALLNFPETKVKTGPLYGIMSPIEVSVKAVAMREEARAKAGEKGNAGDNGEAGEKGKPVYYYRFAPDIPGWDNPGTFHSVDLWFFFNNLDKCWRPMVGRHYDLARKMSSYWVNFIKTGDPNGVDFAGEELPAWAPYTDAGKDEMEFTPDGPVAKKETSDYIHFIAKNVGHML